MIMKRFTGKKYNLFRIIASMLILSLLIGSLSACGKNKPAEDIPAQAATDKAEPEDEGKSSENEEKQLEKADESDELGEIEIPSFDKDTFPIIDGSTATLPLGRLMYRMSVGAEELEAATDINFSKTTESYVKLMDGDNDLVIAYEAGNKAKEDERYRDLIIEPIGLDALVFLCNESNKVESLTADEIRKIYTGSITNWEEVGGDNNPIIPFQRPENSGSQTLMEKLMMGGKKMAAAPEALTPSEMGDLIEAVANYDNSEGAIGYSVYYYAANMYKIPEVKLMAVDGVMPKDDTIRSGEYSFVNPFYVAIRKDTPDDAPAKMLFDWLTGTDGQSLINALGYVGVKDSSKSLPDAYKTTEAYVDTGDRQLIINAEICNGNAGIIVFDRNLKFQKYIPDVQIFGSADYAMSRNNMILARSNKDKTGTKNTGLYDLENESWIIEPQYERATMHFKDGELYRYYLYNYDEDYSMTILSADANGQIVNETVNEDNMYEAYSSYEPQNQRTDWHEDNSYDFYFADRVKLHREYADDGVQTSELYIDDKLIQKSSVSYVDPLEGMLYSADRLPTGYIGIGMYDIDDYDTYEMSNCRYVVINDKGEEAYTINLPPNEWMMLSAENFCMTSGGEGVYKLITTSGETITAWRYDEYSEAYDNYYE